MVITTSSSWADSRFEKFDSGGVWWTSFSTSSLKEPKDDRLRVAGDRAADGDIVANVLVVVIGDAVNLRRAAKFVGADWVPLLAWEKRRGNKSC